MSHPTRKWNPSGTGRGTLGRRAGWLITWPSRSFAAAVAVLTAVLLLFQALGGPPAPAASPAPTSQVPPALLSVAAVPYAGGRAFVGWAAGSGAPSNSYKVETYRYSSTGLQDLGGVAAVGVSTVVVGLQPGLSYVFSVSALNSAGVGPVSTTRPLVAAGSVPPPTPAGASLSTSGNDNQLLVSWDPLSSPVAAEQYQIGVFQGTGSSLHQVGSVACDAPCSSMILQAQPGTVTSAVISGRNPAGGSGYDWSNPVSVPQPCPLACVTVGAGSPGPSLQHQPEGFLDPNGPANPGPLAPTQWRTNMRTLSQTPASVLNAVKGASITEILSDDWLTGHNIAGYAFTPWSNWSAYSQWVGSEVRSALALGQQRGFTVTYWEVQNEPFGGYYYSPSSQPPASETVGNFEEQFLIAYQAIKAADPTAAVIGPSLIAWNAEPGDTPAVGIDLTTFLNFCVLHNIQLGGVSFHANNFGTVRGWYAADGSPAQPSAVESQVAELSSMLAARPSLGHPAILVNEYGDPYTSELPGWNVGWISALGASGVTGAGRSCWDGCGASLDGLLSGDGTAPRPAYWAYAFYASMTGTSVPVTSTYTDVTGVASANPNGSVSVLVGRHQSCTRAINSYCPSYTAKPATVTVQLPNAASAVVTMAAIPAGSTKPLYGLGTTQTTVPVTNGWATITTPALNDGDAVEITASPAT